MANVLNREKKAEDWNPDIAQSTKTYLAWYPDAAKKILARTRNEAAELVEKVRDATDDLRDVTAKTLAALPSSCYVLRQTVLPPLARDRLVNLSGVSASLIKNMELNGSIGKQTKATDAALATLGTYFEQNLDPGLVPWISEKRDPTTIEITHLLDIVGERHSQAVYASELRNEQERRQKELLRKHLVARGFTEIKKVDDDTAVTKMPPGHFSMGRNLDGAESDGTKRNVPTDCVISPLVATLPLIALELKSAGDFTNVNKRRKEEADKHQVLKNEHGDAVVMLLQLFGFFDHTYLRTEKNAGIDWAWDHRLDDLDPHLGYKP